MSTVAKIVTFLFLSMPQVWSQTTAACRSCATTALATTATTARLAVTSSSRIVSVSQVNGTGSVTTTQPTRPITTISTAATTNTTRNRSTVTLTSTEVTSTTSGTTLQTTAIAPNTTALASNTTFIMSAVQTSAVPSRVRDTFTTLTSQNTTTASMPSVFVNQNVLIVCSNTFEQTAYGLLSTASQSSAATASASSAKMTSPVVVSSTAANLTTSSVTNAFFTSQPTTAAISIRASPPATSDVVTSVTNKLSMSIVSADQLSTTVGQQPLLSTVASSSTSPSRASPSAVQVTTVNSSTPTDAPVFRATAEQYEQFLQSGIASISGLVQQNSSSTRIANVTVFPYFDTEKNTTVLVIRLTIVDGMNPSAVEAVRNLKQWQSAASVRRRRRRRDAPSTSTLTLKLVDIYNHTLTPVKIYNWTDTGPCPASSCQNGGICINANAVPGVFVCSCPPTFPYGPYCSEVTTTSVLVPSTAAAASDCISRLECIVPAVVVPVGLFLLVVIVVIIVVTLYCCRGRRRRRETGTKQNGPRKGVENPTYSMYKYEWNGQVARPNTSNEDSSIDMSTSTLTTTATATVTSSSSEPRSQSRALFKKSKRESATSRRTGEGQQFTAKKQKSARSANGENTASSLGSVVVGDHEDPENEYTKIDELAF